MTVEAFDIGIVGAGIGGLALAIGLTRLNVPFTLYETAPAFSAVGAGVGLGPNALQAMDLIDKRFRNMYVNIATGNLNPDKKHVMMEAMLLEKGLGQEEHWWGNGVWGAQSFERTAAHRKDLLEIMASLIKQEVIRFNKKVKTVEQTSDQVVLTFEDGQVVKHAAVIGCDGVKGLTRHIVLGNQHPQLVRPQYTGKYVYRAIVPMADAKEVLGDLATDAKMYMSKGASLATYPISEGKALNVGAFKRSTEPWTYPDATHSVTREDMMNDFRSYNPDPRLTKLLDWAEPVRWAIFHHPDTPTYYRSLVCLMGDVAHASGPHQGAGAGQCLEDALVLSRVLGRLHRNTPESILRTPGPLRTKITEAAFEAYDKVRRPRAQKQVCTSQDCGEIYSLMDPTLGDDIVEAVRHLNDRFAWIWEHDLAADVQQAEAHFDLLLGSVSSSLR